MTPIVQIHPVTFAQRVEYPAPSFSLLPQHEHVFVFTVFNVLDYLVTISKKEGSHLCHQSQMNLRVHTQNRVMWLP